MSTFDHPEHPGPYRRTLIVAFTLIVGLAVGACGGPSANSAKPAPVDIGDGSDRDVADTTPAATKASSPTAAQTEPPPSQGDPASAPESTPTLPEASVPPLSKDPATEPTTTTEPEPSEDDEGSGAQPAPAKPKLDAKALTAEFRQVVTDWIAAVDGDDRDAAGAILASEEDLGKLLTESQLNIIRGHLLPANMLVMETLLNSAESQSVSLTRLGKGHLQLPNNGESGLPVPVVINSLVEITIGDLPISLEFRRAFRISTGWKVMEIVIRY